MGIVKNLLAGMVELGREYYAYEQERAAFLEKAKADIERAMNLGVESVGAGAEHSKEEEVHYVPTSGIREIKTERRALSADIEIPPYVLIEGPNAVRNWLFKYAQSLGDNEPIFILRAQDMIAPAVVREWAYQARRYGVNEEKIDGARRIADKMEDWQWENDKRKVAD